MGEKAVHSASMFHAVRAAGQLADIAWLAFGTWLRISKMKLAEMKWEVCTSARNSAGRTRSSTLERARLWSG